MFNVGPGELIAILALALIVLGPQRLPEAVRTVGRVVGELRRISSGFQDELRNALDDSEAERDISRLRSTEPEQRTLPLDDQPELPLGAVQYPSGIEPIDVDVPEPDSPTSPDGPDAADAPEPAPDPGPVALVDDVGAGAPAAAPAPAPALDLDDEPDKDPAIDEDPEQPYEPPTDGEHAVS